jgi:hypothetical protein
MLRRGATPLRYVVPIPSQQAVFLLTIASEPDESLLMEPAVASFWLWEHAAVTGSPIGTYGHRCGLSPCLGDSFRCPACDEWIAG